jgi:hypothetical protein
MRVLTACTLILSVVSLGCADLGDKTVGNGNSTTTVSFTNDIRPILTTVGCTMPGCHGTLPASGNMLLGNADYATVRNAAGDHGTIIVPGNAAVSNMYLKTTSTPPFGARMPFGGPYLSTAEQLLIRDWINEGALDN